MRHNWKAWLALVLAAGTVMLLAGCGSESEEETDRAKPTPSETEEPEWVACAYDGMHMRKAGMAAQGEFNGETVYFCSEEEKALFEESPDSYYNHATIGDMTLVFGALSDEEHKTFAENMSMTGYVAGAHHLFAVLHDEDGAPVADADVFVEIELESGTPLTGKMNYSEMMKRYSASIALPSGQQCQVKLTVTRGAEKLSTEFTYLPK